MQHSSVEKLFQEEIQYYSKADQASESPIYSLFLHWVKNKRVQQNLRVCEFGGGAGQLLQKISVAFPHVHLTNAEIVDTYKNFLVSKKIKFVKASILNSKFPNNSYDVLIIRDVLHHLVGKNLAQSRNNQRLALEEIRRIVRPGGAIFIEEYTNNSAFSSYLIYHLTRLNLQLGISIPRFHISPYVNIAFLSPPLLLSLAHDVFGKRNILVNKCSVVDVDFKSRLVNLGAKLIRVALVISAPIQ